MALALARSGARVMLNGFGDVDGALAQVRQFDPRRHHDGADMSKPSRSRPWCAALRSRTRQLRHPGQQRRHPACGADRGLSRSSAGTRSSPSTSARPSTPCAPRCPACSKRNWGRIINVASVHGLVASAQKSAYVAAKHGIVGLTKVAALENATTGVTVNAICPGWVLTPLVQKQVDARAAADGVDNEEAKRRTAGREAAVAAVHHARAAGRTGAVHVFGRRRQRARRGLAGGRRLDRAVAGGVDSARRQLHAAADGGGDGGLAGFDRQRLVGRTTRAWPARASPAGLAFMSLPCTCTSRRRPAAKAELLRAPGRPWP
jgi:3-hydroxybutyrate dehydrogenase